MDFLFLYGPQDGCQSKNMPTEFFLAWLNNFFFTLPAVKQHHFHTPRHIDFRQRKIILNFYCQFKINKILFLKFI